MKRSRNGDRLGRSTPLLACTNMLMAALVVAGCQNNTPAEGQPTSASTTQTNAAIKPEIAYANIAISDLQQNVATAGVTIILTNPNPVQASVPSFVWTVYYKENGNWEPLGQVSSDSRQIQPNSSTTYSGVVTGPVASDGTAKYPRIEAFSPGQDVQLRVAGSVSVEVGNSRFAVPFDVTRQFANPAG
jgi:hypothetical protein